MPWPICRSLALVEAIRFQRHWISLESEHRASPENRGSVLPVIGGPRESVANHVRAFEGEQSVVSLMQIYALKIETSLPSPALSRKRGSITRRFRSPVKGLGSQGRGRLQHEKFKLPCLRR